MAEGGLPRRPLGADFNAIWAHRPGTRNRWHLTSRMTMTKANAIAKSMAYHIELANPGACQVVPDSLAAFLDRAIALDREGFGRQAAI